MPRILFLHGLESSPSGLKARWLAEHYQAWTPALTTGDWSLALAQARAGIQEWKPDLLIGSSFGGALLLALLLEGSWQGPCIFIAQAGVRLGVGQALPSGTRAILLHGTEDAVVPLEGSRLLAASGGEGVELWEIPGGDHRLEGCLMDGTLDRAIQRVLLMNLFQKEH